MYKDHKEGCSVVLEAVADNDLWIWHVFLGMSGSHNGINVLQGSNVFSRLVECHTSLVNFVINGHKYNKGYYFVDDIYSRWATFVKTITDVVPGSKILGLRSVRRLAGRMSSMQFVCSRLDSLLSTSLHLSGRKIRCGIL
jgi:hypothetical protein